MDVMLYCSGFFFCQENNYSYNTHWGHVVIPQNVSIQNINNEGNAAVDKEKDM
jgi:hypothetical protein